MKKPRKAKLITPFFMLLAGAITSIAMFAKGVDFLTMLITLLIVLLIFYFIGDVIRYIYEMVQPRVIGIDDSLFMIDENGHVVERLAQTEDADEEETADEADAEVMADAESETEADIETFAEEDFAENDEYSEEDLAEEM